MCTEVIETCVNFLCSTCIPRYVFIAKNRISGKMAGFHSAGHICKCVSVMCTYTYNSAYHYSSLNTPARFMHNLET